MKLIDLFSGIGGFSLAGHWLGWETVAFVEWDKFCKKVLKKNFPNIPIHGDIRQFDGTEYRGTVDVVCGGFPCQPYSIAGKRQGSSDDRDQWPQMLRVISEIRPNWAICENVANLLNMGFDTFIADLESIGYQTITLDISADTVGLPTMERHIWIVATPNKERCKRVGTNQVQRINALQGKFQGSYKGIEGKWDLSKSRFCNVGERVSRRLDKSQKIELEQIGNSIPPQVAYEIFKAIQSVEHESTNRKTEESQPA